MVSYNMDFDSIIRRYKSVRGRLNTEIDDLQREAESLQHLNLADMSDILAQIDTFREIINVNIKNTNRSGNNNVSTNNCNINNNTDNTANNTSSNTNNSGNNSNVPANIRDKMLQSDIDNDTERALLGEDIVDISKNTQMILGDAANKLLGDMNSINNHIENNRKVYEELQKKPIPTAPIVNFNNKINSIISSKDVENAGGIEHIVPVIPGTCIPTSDDSASLVQHGVTLPTVNKMSGYTVAEQEKIKLDIYNKAVYNLSAYSDKITDKKKLNTLIQHEADRLLKSFLG